MKLEAKETLVYINHRVPVSVRDAIVRISKNTGTPQAKLVSEALKEFAENHKRFLK